MINEPNTVTINAVPFQLVVQSWHRFLLYFINFYVAVLIEIWWWTTTQREKKRNGNTQLVRRIKKSEDVKNDKIIFILCAKGIVRFIFLFSIRPFSNLLRLFSEPVNVAKPSLVLIWRKKSFSLWKTVSGNKLKWQAKQTIKFLCDIQTIGWKYGSETRVRNNCIELGREYEKLATVPLIMCLCMSCLSTWRDRDLLHFLWEKSCMNAMNWTKSDCCELHCCRSFSLSLSTLVRLLAYSLLLSSSLHIIFNLRQFFHYANSKADVVSTQ